MKNIKTNLEENTLVITINRPDKLNALNETVLTELESIIIDNRDKPNIKCVIITGEGDKAFVAGADIKEMSSFSSMDAIKYSNKGINLFNIIESYPKPIIAAVNGYALGGGLELALACHIRYISKNAILGLPEVSLGLIPGFGGTQRLRNIVGLGNAIEIITSANHIKSEDAKKLGLANKICDNVLEESIELCKKISKNSSTAIRNAIQSIVSGMNVNYYDSFSIENNLFSQLYETEDSKEGMLAFLERRKPKFKD
ncbi:MAG: enoyl-CoA hydratase [Candidatus Marinimicrobia bacterium]|nr:enoyl-CoA hydratase [Candidatus Neomarinimicrobiota bacterium]MAM99040.1 enoyl-CoA hydratase [Candidatus Neomarinimicrobiota bacterium]|tara:strand:- start:98 stop:865 length:768 start_codon:yes stop_codon:yes gene_type:complete